MDDARYPVTAARCGRITIMPQAAHQQLAASIRGGMALAAAGLVCAAYGAADGLGRFFIGPWEACAAALALAVMLCAAALATGIRARNKYRP